MADDPKRPVDPLDKMVFPTIKGIDPKALARDLTALGRLDLSKLPGITTQAGKSRTSADESGGVAGGGTESRPKGKRRKQQSSLPVRGGSREMKAYAVTEDELENLGLLSIASTVAFSLASFLGAFWLGVKTSIALSTGVKADVISYWQGLSTAGGVAALLLVMVGFFLIWRGHTKIAKIKAATDHG